MASFTNRAVLAGIAGVVLLATAQVSAQTPHYGCYWPSPRWSVYVRDHIPYFAKHPPVYYSYPVARTYGYSPYAYPPGVRTPEPDPPQPLIIRSPFITRAEGRSPALSTAQTQPLRIGPFLDIQDDGSDSSPEAAPKVRRTPKLVKPAPKIVRPVETPAGPDPKKRAPAPLKLPVP